MDEGGIPPFVIGDGVGLDVMSVVDIFMVHLSIDNNSQRCHDHTMFFSKLFVK